MNITFQSTPDDALWKSGYIVIGIDEAGRGPLAGPVSAAACMLDPDKFIPGINDSKKLTSNERENLEPLIQTDANAWAVSHIEPDIIDEINIYQATILAMKSSLEKVLHHPIQFPIIEGKVDNHFNQNDLRHSFEALLNPILPKQSRIANIFIDGELKEVHDKTNPYPILILVDGNMPYMGYGIQINLIKGDSASPSIGAASILAKVARDRIMIMLDKRYPEYGFAAHKGYCTRMHVDALRKFGHSPIHRRSFHVKSLEEQ
ncbi:ribonuclease HII [bacterium]|nr:ribonuclease HII [bacterium]